MPHPRLYLVDNTLPCDLPDLHDCIPDNDHSELPSIAFMLGGAVYRLWRMAFWVALGLVVGVFVL